ncbi:uncharacterized protein T551_03705, partial [Pneumocystis jirovecii RU7]
ILARAVARAVKRQAKAAQGASVYEEEEYLLALILRENVMKEQECKEKLKEYCQRLRNITQELNIMGPKLKEICKDDTTAEAKCTKLETKVKEKCTTFETKLGIAAKKDVSTLEDNDCKENERQCLFLEGACPSDLTENCNKLRNLCYQRKRDGVAEEVLLRAFRGDLKDKSGCEKKIKNVCLKIGQESDELTKLCLYQKETCDTLMTKKQNKCDFLKTKIEELLKKKGFKTKCPVLLRECHFYEETCTDKLKCKELVNNCKEKNVVYTEPGSNFEPIRPGITLAEEIELEELYKEAAKKGVRIGRPPTRDATELLFLLSQSGTKSTVAEKCKEVLDKKCKDLKEHKFLKDLCEKDKINEDGKKKCNELDKELATRASIVSKEIEKYLDIANGKEIISWHVLHTFLSERKCTKLLSDCFYFTQDKGPLNKECDNLKAACYKKGLEAPANEALQDKLRGKLQGLNETWLKNLRKNLIKVCEKMKGESDELFVLCMNPIKTALTVSTDLRLRAVALQEHLNEKRDFPTKKDCKELEEKCEVLGKDSKEIKWSCYTLKQHCNRLESIEQLEEELLKENKGYLKDENSCKEEAKKRCEKWFRRENSKFFPACSDLELVCKKIIRNVESKCNILKGYMETMKIVDKIENKEEEVCGLWAPYCKKFTPSCTELEENGGKGCKKLNKKCESFFKKKELENKAIDGLKGNLATNEECKETLKKYCVALTNATNGLETLCKSNEANKKDEDVRKEVCEKLVKQVQEKCLKLQEELTEISEKLKEKGKNYEKIKKEAEEAMKEANLVLSRLETTNKKSANNAVNNASVAPKETKDATQFKLIRRNTNTQVTKKELEAFDLVARAFDLYVELKEICDHSLKDCGFKKECKCENPCGKIQEVCSKLEPLKVKPYETTTKNITTTTTTTTTTTVTDPKATDCQSLQTTDTWVTKTSTHTSTSTTTSTVTSRITLTSTRRCKPTKCTTGEEDEAGEVKPSEGLRMSGWSVMRGVLVVMMISFMI